MKVANRLKKFKGILGQKKKKRLEVHWIFQIVQGPIYVLDCSRYTRFHIVQGLVYALDHIIYYKLIKITLPC